MFLSLDLQTIWFILIAILLTGYAILDGFDLGVGALHLLVAKTDDERRLFMNAIGPVWDGNEVWLITGGGALFAAFPIVYATVFSGFYLALILVLLALIMRAVAIEFRHQENFGWWKKTWDVSFSVGSILASLLFGVALGNIAIGVPIDNHLEFAGTFLGLLNPYALLVGVTTLVLFTGHGSIYLLNKLEGDLQQRVRNWVIRIFVVFCSCYMLLTISTFVFVPHLTAAIQKTPILYLLVAFNIIAVLSIPFFVGREKYGRAFIASTLNICCLMALFAIGMYPNLVFSSSDPATSLTIFNASSSQHTQAVMFTIALIGMPLVIAYSAVVHYIFRGKTRLEKDSY